MSFFLVFSLTFGWATCLIDFANAFVLHDLSGLLTKE